MKKEFTFEQATQFMADIAVDEMQALKNLENTLNEDQEKLYGDFIRLLQSYKQIVGLKEQEALEDGELWTKLDAGLYSGFSDLMRLTLQEPFENLIKDTIHHTGKQFEDDLEDGWDFAIEELEQRKQQYGVTLRTDIEALIAIYYLGYQTSEYIEQEDPDVDGGLLFDIRSFAINQILDLFHRVEKAKELSPRAFCVHGVGYECTRDVEECKTCPGNAKNIPWS